MNPQPLHELWELLLPPERRWLGLIVLISLAGHGACFFLFKVQPVASAGLPARPGQVTLISTALPARAGSSAGGGMIWMEWRDPSVIALPRSPLPGLTGNLRLPQWKQEEPAGAATAPLSFHEFTPRADMASLSQQVSDDLKELKMEPKGVQIETPPPLSGTIVQITGALSERVITKKTELSQPPADRDLKATVLSLSVNMQGVVENVLVDTSCEDSAIDQVAVRELKNWRFGPAPALQWGKAFIYWHFKEKPAPVTQPAP